MKKIVFTTSFFVVLFLQTSAIPVQSVTENEPVADWYGLKLITKADKSVFTTPVCDFKQ